MRQVTTRTRLAISLVVLGSLLGAACSSDNDTGSEPESTIADDSAIDADAIDTDVSDTDDATSSDPAQATDIGSEVTIEPTPYSPIAALATVLTGEPSKVSII